MQKFNTVRFDKSEDFTFINKVNTLLGDKKRTYFIETYGCQMNVRDSQSLAGLFEAMGYLPATDMLSADAIIFNTCCVREGAEDRLTGNLGRLLPLKQEKPETLIMICGCMMQQQKRAEYIKKRFKFVDIVFGTNACHKLPQLMFDCLSKQERAFYYSESTDIIEDVPSLREKTTSAFVNIMYGCNNFCSYCIVPYVRGRERSRASEDIIKECKDLAKSGIKEITLLGQNVNSYGLSSENEISFAELLRSLNQIEGLERIRFMTSHPKDLSDELIRVFAECKKVCNYIHLPVQSGSNRLLQKMNRKYTREHYLDLVARLREAVPDIAISTDLIVGFPGETDEDFEQTLDLYRKACFNSAFTFIYSKRDGTPAAQMEDQIAPEISHARLDALIKLSEECTLKANQKYLGNTYEVLVEGASKRNETMLSGRTEHGRMVSFVGSPDLINKIVNVKITEIKLNTLVGILEDK